MTDTPKLSIQRTASGASFSHAVDDADAKLVWRSTLPGASTYDRAAHVLRRLQAEGTTAVDLLPLALPTSWMVNAKATSHAMQRWLARPALDAWTVLLDQLDSGLSPAEWLARPANERASVTAAVTVLASGGNGASLASVSKVLALLRPQLVPLMDDAALWFALELVAEPTTADSPSAPASAFIPMLDWFAGQVIASEEQLIALAVRHDRAVLDAAQVLDRLLWIESWGHRLR